MAVTVHFKNGGHTTVGHAVTVDPDQFPADGPASAERGSITLKDADGNVVGCFFQAEIVGYFIHEASGRSGFR